MTTELNERLIEWIEFYGISQESLNDFANVYSASYEKYNTIWEFLQEILDGMKGE